MKLCVQAIYIYFPFLIPQRHIWAKKKALSGFLFVHLVTLPGGPGHAGGGEDGGDGVDAHARVKSFRGALGLVRLGVGGGVVVVVGRLLGSGVGNLYYFDSIPVGIDQQILALRVDLVQRCRGGFYAAARQQGGFRASEREYLSFFVKRKVPKKTA